MQMVEHVKGRYLKICGIDRIYSNMIYYFNMFQSFFFISSERWVIDLKYYIFRNISNTNTIPPITRGLQNAIQPTSERDGLGSCQSVGIVQERLSARGGW